MAGATGLARKRAAAAARASSLGRIALVLAAVMLGAALPGAFAQCYDQAAMTALAESFLPNAGLTGWNTNASPVRSPRVPGPGCWYNRSIT